MGPLLLHRRTPSSYIYLRTPKRPDTEPKPNSTLGEIGHLGRTLLLHGLALADGVLQLLLYLGHPLLVLAVGDLFRL